MKKNKPSIRSSKLTLKFANANKCRRISEFVDEYERVVRVLVERFWKKINGGEQVSAMPSGEITEVDSWLSARAIQCAAKQASGIANGSLAKNKRREWQAQQFDKAGKHKKARVLRAIIVKNKVTCPNVSNIEAQLDNRFFEMQPSVGTSFDTWFEIKSIGSPSGERGVKTLIPINFHKHFNELNKIGKCLNSIRLSRSNITLSFELPDPVGAGSDQKTLGIDIGQTSIFSVSDGSQIKKGNHGWTLKSINDKMGRRKRGSKGFRRAKTHCKNFIGESVNRLNLSGVSTVRIERIKHLKKGRRTSKSLSHWSATTLLNAVKQKATLLGVRVEEVNPMFSSQRCSCCGWVQKANRNGERFVCKKCNTALNADMNGSINISLDLPLLPKTARDKGWNLKGFFWRLNGFTTPTDEFIVRQAQKPTKNVVVDRQPHIFQ